MAFVFDGSVQRLEERVSDLEDQALASPNTWINVKATPYGAKGDGTTDDRDAIQAALDAGAGGTVFIPEGTYLISRSLRPNSNTTLLGAGNGTCIQIVPGGWTVTLDNGVPAVGTINYGAICLYAVHDILIANMRIRSAKDTSDAAYEYSPNCIQLENVQRIWVDHCTLENAHYSVSWSAGTQINNQHLYFTNNYVYDASYTSQSDLLGNGGGGVVQWSGQHIIYANNQFQKVGCGISASGQHVVVANNTFRDFQAAAIFTGDNDYGNDVAIVGNVFDTTPNLVPGGVIWEPTAIFCNNNNDYGVGGWATSTLVCDNAIYARITGPTAIFKGIVIRGLDAVVSNNTVGIDMQYDSTGGTPNRLRGFCWEQNAHWAPTIMANHNTVWGYSSVGSPMSAATGITAFSMSPGANKITLYEQGSVVRGMPETCTAWEYFYTASGHFAVYQNGCVNRGGGQRIGQQYINATTRNIPISLAYDSVVHASNWQVPGITYGNPTLENLTVSNAINVGVIQNTDVLRVDVPLDSALRFSENSGSPMAEVRYGEFRAAKFRYGSPTGWGFGSGMVHTYGTAAPVSGTWAVGDLVWNSAPAAGGTPGWVCVSAGTPGTWKALASIAA